MKTDKGKLLYMSPDNLSIHPKNLRRFYSEDQVREMADSIRSAKGVSQAMLVVQNGTEGKYFVVDGNMRLAGGRLLGKECPPLKCEVIDAGKAEQLLIMAVTAKIRYSPDPISEALHYKRLMDEEHYSIRKIAQSTGIHETIISNRLKLISLDPEIQELIGTRRLSSDPRVVKALLSIEDARVRVKLAERLAHDEANIKTILVSCERLKIRLRETSKSDFKKTPMLDIGEKRAFGKTIPPEKTVGWDKVREAAKAMCNKCDIKTTSLKTVPEPAWSIISHSAEQTCLNCNLREIKSSCTYCPGADIIHRLIMSTGEQR